MKNDWQPIATAPGPAGIALRLKGWNHEDPEESAIGYYDDYERLWISCSDDEDVFSNYDDEPAFGPTHWKRCRYTVLSHARTFIPQPMEASA